MNNDCDEIKILRRKIITQCYIAKAGHIASSFSCLEILYTLYKNFLTDRKNDFILSKGHAAPALYSVLNHFGYLRDSDYSLFAKYPGILTTHPTHLIPGVQYSSGALGLGLSVGIGMALAKKVKKTKGKVFVLMGDGELNEGSVWEALMYAGSKKINNLIIIIDNNNLQASDQNDKIIKTKPLLMAIQKLGWGIHWVEGHNINAINTLIDKTFTNQQKPIAIIAKTTKGKGVSYMENETTWHHRIPNEVEFKQAIAELS